MWALDWMSLDETRASRHNLNPPAKSNLLLVSTIVLVWDSNCAHTWHLARLPRNTYGPAHGSFTQSSLSRVIRGLQTFRLIKSCQSTFRRCLAPAIHFSLDEWKDWISYHSHDTRVSGVSVSRLCATLDPATRSGARDEAIMIFNCSAFNMFMCWCSSSH